jgi:hypothetical protein
MLKAEFDFRITSKFVFRLEAELAKFTISGFVNFYTFFIFIHLAAIYQNFYRWRTTLHSVFGEIVNCQAGEPMKRIKRTTIKIRHRELVIMKKSGDQQQHRDEEEIIHVCPVCNFPVAIPKNLAHAERPKAALLAENERDEKKQN